MHLYFLQEKAPQRGEVSKKLQEKTPQRGEVSKNILQEKAPQRGGVSEDLDNIEEVAIFDIEIGFLHQTTDFANLAIKLQRGLSGGMTLTILE